MRDVAVGHRHQHYAYRHKHYAVYIAVPSDSVGKSRKHLQLLG
jgi:hypothetical protein